MIHGGDFSRRDKCWRNRQHFKNGDFSHWVGNGDWGIEPSHWHWRKVDLRYRKPKSVK